MAKTKSKKVVQKIDGETEAEKRLFKTLKKMGLV